MSDFQTKARDAYYRKMARERYYRHLARVKVQKRKDYLGAAGLFAFLVLIILLSFMTNNGSHHEFMSGMFAD